MLSRPCTGPPPPLASKIGSAEPAATPISIFASQVITGLSGIVQKRSPPPSVDMPYEAKAEPLHTIWKRPYGSRRKPAHACCVSGMPSVDNFLMIKRAEVARYNSTVTDWEQREYFDLF